MSTLPAVDPILYYLGLGSALKLTLGYLAGRSIPKEYVGKVAECYVYPLKSGGGVKATELECSFQEGAKTNGLTDRHWLVVNTNNESVHYSTMPMLATVSPGRIGDVFTLQARGMEPLRVDLKEVETRQKQATIALSGVTVQGLDGGDAAAKWINDFLGTSGYRLMYAPPGFDAKRPVATGNKKYAAWTKKAKQDDQIAYQSVTPYHMLTTNSVEDLNSRLGSPVPVDRFRCNVLINADRAYTEDTWTEISIGDVRFSTIKLTGRCKFTTIDTSTGEVGTEPLQMLNSYRTLVKDPGFGPCLGIQMVLKTSGTIRVGDPVYVIRGDNTVKPQ